MIAAHFEAMSKTQSPADLLRLANIYAPSEIADGLTPLRLALQERDEAREWVEKLQRTTQTLTCVYCGKEYPPGTPAHGSEVLTEHIRACEKHPMRKVEADRERLRSALFGLVGCADEELETMEITIRSIPAPMEDKAVSIDAIHALIATRAAK
jgi:hypothetical protein